MGAADYMTGYASRKFELIENLYERAYLTYYKDPRAQEKAIDDYVKALRNVAAERAIEQKAAEAREAEKANEGRTEAQKRLWLATRELERKRAQKRAEKRARRKTRRGQASKRRRVAA
ncbi:hypothetical protein [Nocardia wallacei]|uniref:hypothetical protein n=1 Tax=Nocardia wallacei TaxID=480035 RepID=UPI0024561ED3|nr:hypothetical protein [Nocardia wallacei]